MKPALLTLLALVLAQEGIPTVEPGDWVTYGEVTKSLPAEGELRFDYKIGASEFPLMMLPLASGFSKMKVLRFEAMTGAPRTIAVSLEEQKGGRWTAIVAMPKEGWQKIELAEGDFSLSTDPEDPKDPNGKLDLPLVRTLSLFDMDTFFVKDKSPVTQLAFPDAIAGPRALSIRNIAFSPDALAAGGLDGLARPQPGWLPLGGVRLRRTESSPLEGGPALEARYRFGAMRLCGLVRTLPPGALEKKSALSLNIASEKPASLLLQLEDDRGARWGVSLDVPGEKKKKSIRLALTDWQPSPDSKEPEAKMDLARIKQINLADTRALSGTEPGENVLWLSGLSAQ